MRPVILKGKKVSLGILLHDDLKKSWEWFNERSTVRNLLNSAHFTLPEDEEEFYEELKKNKDKMPTFAVIENGGEKLIGIAGFNWINWGARWGDTLLPLAGGEGEGLRDGGGKAPLRIRLRSPQPPQGLGESP